MERLVDAQLLEVAGRDHFGQTRYHFHDLVRLFAKELLDQEEPVDAQKVALQRVLDAQLARARIADSVLQSGRVSVSTRVAGVALEDRLRHDPLGWFNSEHAGLVALVGQGYEAELFQPTREVALAYFFDVRGHVRLWQHTHEIALEAARRSRDRPGEADTLRSIAIARWEMGDWVSALSDFEESLRIARELGQPPGGICSQ
ncbi:tetratricopeptide repeat protein [Streptomyces sp. NPDC019990]|uniref:tetratricopeptide repeat protein n=1 Tax=Streptomyces sp. NPDC019990 TaxID=3154693 RepID=UPI0033E9D77E